ncbi:MAG: caspase family protein [Pseudomonadota bacterium]
MNSPLSGSVFIFWGNVPLVMRILSAFLMLFVCTLPAFAERVALVMGNGSYLQAEPLKNAANDARDMAARLRSLGFTVYEGIDLPRVEAMRLVQDFSQNLKSTDTAMFYFAGHATQIGSQNYLMPVDAMSGDEDTLVASSISLQAVLSSLETRARTRLVILDACRNNPFLNNTGTSRSVSSDRGLFKMDAGVGSFIAFSTAPGTVAADGAGRNSPFTEALLRHMDRPGENIHAVMRRVRSDVMQASNNRQIPWENSALIDEVFLVPQPQLASTEQSQSGTLQQQNSQNQQTLITPAPTLKPQFQATHKVFGLDPNGDGFLALRQGPTSQTRMITMLTEGTPLRAYSQSGRWLQVETPEGLSGWAHSNWIRSAPQSATRQNLGTGTGSASAINQCDQLWYQRNAYFAAKGYCFKSDRGKATFPNANCIPGLAAGDVPLSTQERAQIAAIKQQETALGCR